MKNTGKLNEHLSEEFKNELEILKPGKMAQQVKALASSLPDGRPELAVQGAHGGKRIDFLHIIL